MGRLKLRGAILPTAFALAIAAVALADMFVDHPLLDAVGARLVMYGVIVAAFALLVGIGNLLGSHLRTAQQRGEGAFYSLFLVIVAVGLLTWGLVSGGTASPLLWWLRYVIVPLQSSFFALLAFFVLGVAYRSQRGNAMDRLVFAVSAAIVIIGASPLAAQFLGPIAAQAKAAFMVIPVAAGARGLLLGIALGTIATGLRLIFDGRHYFK